jgi:hypothetical protein
LIENYGVGLAYDVKLSGMNVVEENNLSGLEIVTLGAVSINSISASANGQSSVIGDGYGVFVDNTGMSKAVTFTGTHSFVGNFEDGLHLNSQGQIKIGSISANSNGANGVSIDNQTGPSTSTVVFTGTNTFTENADLGLFVVSNGAFTLSNLVAEFNDLGGVQLDNSAASTAAAVSLTGASSFNNNALLVADSYGLLVKSRGAISISNVTANGNGFIGVRLNNKDYAAIDSFPAVTLTGINTFSNNGSFGLDIYAAGEVSLTKIIADGNVGDGVSVISNKNVTITCGSMTSNQGLGLNVVTNGVVPGIITLKGVFAYGNFTPNMQLVGASTIMVRSCPIP